LVFALSWVTFGAAPEPATPAGTVPVTAVPPVVLAALLFVEWPMKYAAAKAAPPSTTAIRRIRSGLLIWEARL
jgi:hypothetical protein